MENQITEKDIIEYYSTKEDDLSDCKYTRGYLLALARDGNDRPCKELAKDFETLNQAINADQELLSKMLKDYDYELEVAKECHGLDNYAFYIDLKRIGLEDQYIFEDDSHSIPADVKIFEPYIEVGDKKIISAKWHLLISLYAFIDIVNKTKEEDYEKYCKCYQKCKNYSMNYDRVITSTPCDHWELSKNFKVKSNSLRLWMAEAAEKPEAAEVNVLDSDGKINWNEVTWENVKNKLIKQIKNNKD